MQEDARGEWRRLSTAGEQSFLPPPRPPPLPQGPRTSVPPTRGFTGGHGPPHMPSVRQHPGNTRCTRRPSWAEPWAAHMLSASPPALLLSDRERVSAHFLPDPQPPCGPSAQRKPAVSGCTSPAGSVPLGNRVCRPRKDQHQHTRVPCWEQPALTSPGSGPASVCLCTASPLNNRCACDLNVCRTAAM